LLSADEIEYYSAYGLRQFYLRPRYILDRLITIRSFADVKAYFNNFVGFLKRYVFVKLRL